MTKFTLEDAKKYRYWYMYDYINDEGETCTEDRQNILIDKDEYGDNSVCLYLDSEFVEALGELLPADVRPWYDECEVLTLLFKKFISPFNNNAKFIKGKLTDPATDSIVW